MSHIAFDLDALPLVPKVARSAGIGEAVVGWGLTQMWEWCWREKTDRVTTNHLRGFFGTELGAILVDFGFLEAVGSSLWRVRGSARYLRIQEGRERGGRAAAAAGNLKRGTKRQLETQPQHVPSSSPADSQHTSQLDPRLSATSDERLATSDKRQAVVAAEKVAIVVTPPTSAPDGWLADDFWRWAQHKRQEAGFVAERQVSPSSKLSGWYSQALATLGGDVAALQESFYRFGEDKHWQNATPALPFAAFMSQWPKYAPRRANAQA